MGHRLTLLIDVCHRALGGLGVLGVLLGGLQNLSCLQDVKLD